MAFKKSNNIINDTISFNSLQEAIDAFYGANDIEQKIEAVEYIAEHKPIHETLELFKEAFNKNDLEYNKLIAAAFIAFKDKDKTDEDFDAMFHLLKSDNAYLRNAAIQFLQDNAKEAKDFIIRLMNDEDRDIRIFAINILGDVKYEDSIEMLRNFIVQEKDKDINALMTAVDYLGEIGDETDIYLLEALKAEKKDDPYVTFGVDTAINRIKGK
ncbi:MAG: HEAT repeat domain-containing protein [Epsilonproteobacteria bacterium]|nr:HEAT repeat domain-containing protein [Campylobacterota bacterium]